MPGSSLDVDALFDSIDAERARRGRELAELKRLYAQLSPDPKGLASKSVVVLSYAHWEGFYNSCARVYIRFLRSKSAAISDIDWSLIVGVISDDLKSLRDRNHSTESRCDFVDALKAKLAGTFDNFDMAVVEARSNLDFERLSGSYRVLQFDISPFLRWRNQIDKELVGWRHAVAHGSSPDLSKMDASNHVDFTNQLLLALSDQFQKAIVDRL
jgi:hypothetical protein